MCWHVLAVNWFDGVLAVAQRRSPGRGRARSALYDMKAVSCRELSALGEDRVGEPPSRPRVGLRRSYRLSVMPE